MCGIAGVVGPASSGFKGRGAVQRMTSVLESRGPDSSGFWTQEAVHLGHRRLAVIDIDGGGQPLHLERAGHDHCLVYNGELYGFQRVRRNLEAAGEHFLSNSDTEVLLRVLLRSRTPEIALNSLTGMFAFGWWNSSKQCLLLGRDRVGIKPLYYSHLTCGSLVFASSAAAIMASSLVASRVDEWELGSYLSFGHTTSPNTLFAEVKELPPGHTLYWHNGTITLAQWWGTDWTASFVGAEEDAAERLDELLDTVISDHMVADVPVAAFLSGGLDSSTVVARAARRHPDLLALTVAFSESRFDESDAARRTAEFLGVSHEIVQMHSLRVDVSACKLIVEQLGLPFGDSSALPTLALSRAAAQHVKVVLSGDGGDELFAGYDSFEWLRRIRAARLIPKAARSAALHTLNVGAELFRNSSAIRRIRRGIAYSLLGNEEQLLRLKTPLDPDELAELIPGWNQIPGLAATRRFLEGGRKLSDSQAFTRFLFERVLPNDMLRKVDCMSMAASLEVRVPLLDHRIVEFAHSLPETMKVHNGTRKALLRRVVAPSLPEHVMRSRKMGFSIPLLQAMTAELLQFADDTAGSRDAYVGCLVSPSVVRRLVDGVRKPGTVGRSKWSEYTAAHALWFVLQLETWCRRYRVELEPAVSTVTQRLHSGHRP